MIQTLSNIFQVSIRKSDQVGRWGGEEFLMILPETSAPNAQHLVDHIRVNVMEGDFETVDIITISAGITEFRSNDTTETLIQRADEALYRAKNSGKNRVFIS